MRRHITGMDAPFPEYRPSAPTGYRNFRNAQYAALGILLASLLLMIAQPVAPGPGLYLIFGVTLGISLVLSGLEKIFFQNGYSTAWGRRLNERRNALGPWILYSAQTILLFLGVSLFWVPSAHYILPASFFLHANVVLLMLAIPAYRLVAAYARVTEADHWISAAQLLRSAVLSLAAVLLGGLITAALAPPRQGIPQGSHAFLVLIWLGVLMVPVVCALLWANHVLSRKRKLLHEGVR